MELLLGLLFVVLLLACSVPPFLFFLALFSLTDLPLWLEYSVSFVLGLGGGFVGQVFVFDLLDGARSWKDLRKGNTGITGACWLVGAAGALLATMFATATARLPMGEDVRHILFAVIWAAAATGVGLSVAPPHIRRALLPKRRPLAIWLWRGVVVVAGIVLFFTPAALLTLIQEGAIRPDSPVSWLHILLLLVGGGLVGLVNIGVEKWVERSYQVALWDS